MGCPMCPGSWELPGSAHMSGAEAEGLETYVDRTISGHLLAVVTWAGSQTIIIKVDISPFTCLYHLVSEICFDAYVSLVFGL